MIQEVIRSRIEELLNDNTSGKVFVVGSYVYLEDTNKKFVEMEKHVVLLTFKVGLMMSGATAAFWFIAKYWGG